ncbi:hypothetical protein [Kineosporia sp. A_224]|uniref:hypothetical protein n=1 Tax=Kineosporia sp. A_224 TaxID=1962180 RepID=UPI000B4B0357|nr:hypothetical protein [Kineosporia sp. A_224]
MIPAVWDVPAADPGDPSGPGRPAPSLVSLHYLRAALRRRLRTCVLAAALGLGAGAAYLVAVPPPQAATTTLVLTHEVQQDPARAMATDVSLLRTRTVAARTLDVLGLAGTPDAALTPDALLDSVSIEPVSSDVMRVTLAAPSGAEAERRLDALSAVYLRFRAEQLTAQSDYVVSGMNERIAALQEQVTAISARVADLSTSATASTEDLTDAIAARADLGNQIGSLQQSVQDQTLRTTSLVASSRVVDPAGREPGPGLRHAALVLVSGLVAGTAAGVGLVVFLAVTTDRLRRRSEVATALGAPVPLSVRRLAPMPRWLRPLTNRLGVDERRAVDRRRFAHTLEYALPAPGQPRRLLVACLDNSDDARFGVATVGLVLAEQGLDVSMVDLTRAGRLQDAVRALSTFPDGPAPVVLRPVGEPMLAQGPVDLRRAGGPVVADGADGTDWADGADGHEDLGPDRLVLTLADVDPAVGASALAVWAHRVVVTVTAGRSGVERIRTTADQLRDAGMVLRHAVLLRADRTDDSSGLLPSTAERVAQP